MKINTPSSPQTQLLVKLHQGIEWSIIDAGLHSHLFDYLIECRDANYIAVEKQWNLEKTECLLNALTSIGLLQKLDSRYQLVDTYRNLLNSDHPESMVAMLTHLNKIKMTSGPQLIAKMTEGSFDNSMNFREPSFWSRSTSNLRAFHSSTSADFCANLLQNLPQWKGVNKLLDIGAGTETLAIKLLRTNAQLSVDLFDLPPVIEQINLALTTKYSRLSLHAGDYNTTPLPKEFELIFASMSLYYANSLPKIFTRIHQSLSSDGIFVSLHEGLKKSRTEPWYHVIGRLLPSIQGNNVSFNEGEIAQQLLLSGFRQVHSSEVETPFGPMTLDIGYK